MHYNRIWARETFLSCVTQIISSSTDVCFRDRIVLPLLGYTSAGCLKL